MSPNALAEHMTPLMDFAPDNIRTDSSGLDFGTGFPGYLGEGKAWQSVSGMAGTNNGLIPAGVLGESGDYAGVPASAQMRTNSVGMIPNPDFLGEPGRIDRLATDFEGPVSSNNVENFDAINGSRIRPGRADVAHGGPVGSGNDLGAYLSVAMAQAGYDAPDQNLSQISVLLGI